MLSDPLALALGLAQLLPNLEGGQKHEVLEEAFETARETGSALLLKALVPSLNECLPEALEIAKRFDRHDLLEFMRVVMSC
jgi:hypothetical protein